MVSTFPCNSKKCVNTSSFARKVVIKGTFLLNTKLDALKLGIDDYITKPFNKNELLVRIHNCIKNSTAKKSFNNEHNITINTYSNDDFIHKLKKYVIENSNKSTLNQDVIAEEFNVSKSSFYRKIKSNTGLSPNNFIKESLEALR